MARCAIPQSRRHSALLFTPWLLRHELVMAAAATMLAVAVLFTMFRRKGVRGRRLAGVALLYGVFAAALILWRELRRHDHFPPVPD